MRTALSKCRDNCCRSSTQRHRFNRINESSRCRFGRHPYIITMIVTLAFMLSVLSCMDCQFISVRLEDGYKVYYAGLWTYEGSDGGCLSFNDAKSSKGGLAGTGNYSKFLSAEDQNKGISQGSAVLSAIFGFLALCWSWFTVAKFSSEPPTSVIDDVLLIFIAITFLAEAIKFGYFFNIKLCTEDAWPTNNMKGNNDNANLRTRKMRDRHHEDQTKPSPSQDEATASWVQNLTQAAPKQATFQKSIEGEFQSASGCFMSRGSASSLSSLMLFFVALVMMVGYATRPKRKLRQTEEVNDESDLPSLALGSLLSSSQTAGGSSVPESSRPRASSVATSTVNSDPAKIFQSASKSLDSGSNNDDKLDHKLSQDSGHGSFGSSGGQVGLGDEVKRSTFRQQLGKQRSNSRGKMNSDKRIHREDSNRSAQDERRNLSHRNSEKQIQREGSNRSIKEQRDLSHRISDRKIQREGSNRSAHEQRNLPQQNSGRRISREDSNRSAQVYIDGTNQSNDRQIHREGSNRDAQETRNQLRQDSERQLNREGSSRSAGKECFRETRDSPSRRRSEQYHHSGLEDISSRRHNLDSRRSRIRSSLKSAWKTSPSHGKESRSGRRQSNYIDTPISMPGHDRRLDRQRSRSRSRERDEINEKFNRQNIGSPFLSSTINLNNEKAEDPLDVERAQRMQRFAERSRKFHEFSSKNAYINKFGTDKGTIIQTIVTDRAVGPGAQVSRKLPPPHTRHCIHKIEADMDNTDMSAVTFDRTLV